MKRNKMLLTVADGCSYLILCSVQFIKGIDSDNIVICRIIPQTCEKTQYPVQRIENC